ncbi:hypothetical protein GCM10010191_42960 [Actinomadura vinacea]|uniref:DUF3137 domain-containing protein n=1 Tax=Actinomadura vinacea TaxID=115336 RepID=A0ABN3JD75_9ACTN
MSFPPSVLERAADRKLGDPVRSFDGRVGLRRALAWTGLAVLAGVVPAALAVVLLAAGRAVPGVLAVLLAVVGTAAAGRFVIRPDEMRARNRAVYLFTGGLVLEAGGEPTAFEWDDLVSVSVSGVRHEADGRSRFRFVVVAADGRELRLGEELPEVRELGERVLAEVTGRTLPRLVERVRSGEVVRLGPFAVGPDGVEKEGERLAWPAVAEAGVDNGVVFVRSHDDLASVTAIAARVPNAVAFVELCRHLATVGEDEDVPSSG